MRSLWVYLLIVQQKMLTCNVRKITYVTCNLKPLATTCNLQLYNSYNSDVIFLKAKVIITKGFP